MKNNDGRVEAKPATWIDRVAFVLLIVAAAVVFAAIVYLLSYFALMFIFLIPILRMALKRVD